MSYAMEIQIAKFMQSLQIHTDEENDKAIEHLMENHGHKQGDLTDVASRTVINEILSGKKQLNLGHIRRLSKKYGVPAELFI